MKQLGKVILFILICTSKLLFAQSPSNIDGKVLLRNEQSYFGLIHGLGWGAGFRYGNNISTWEKRMYEVSFFTLKHPKEVKMVNSLLFMNAKSYVYGKKNFFFLIETSIGKQKILNEKPYWGGVEVRSFYSIGPVLGFTKPVYLYIFDFSGTSISQRLEKYNPELHFYDNIYGRGPFMKGIDEIKLHPGLHFKLGLNIEHGTNDETVNSIEAGAMLNVFLKPVEIMGFTQNDFLFINLYIQYHLGKRF
jgi:hypothetical protein